VELTTSAFDKYEKKIREVLRDEALPLEEILAAFSPKRQAEVADALSYLLDEGKLTLNEAGKIALDSRS
jgi:hypothetical protein